MADGNWVEKSRNRVAKETERVAKETDPGRASGGKATRDASSGSWPCPAWVGRVRPSLSRSPLP